MNGANFYCTECDMTKLLQSVIWILTIGMSCKHTMVWIQDICEKSIVLTKSIVRTLLSINFVIDDSLTCNVCKVHDVGGKFQCISNYHVFFNLIISKTNHISFTLKRMP